MRVLFKEAIDKSTRLTEIQTVCSEDAPFGTFDVFFYGDDDYVIRNVSPQDYGEWLAKLMVQGYVDTAVYGYLAEFYKD